MDERRARPFVYLVAAVASLGGLMYGYDIGGSGGTLVMQGFREHFGWGWPIPAKETQQVLAEQGWMNALFTFGALVGALPAGTLADFLGRRATVMYSALLFLVAASLQTAAVDMSIMFVGRVIAGMSIGAISAIVPVYISECAPEHCRGKLSTFWMLAVTIGIVLAGTVNIPLATFNAGWRVSYAGNIVFSALLFGMMLCVMPESPRWLMSKGQEDRAATALGKLRYEHEVASEMDEIKRAIAQEQSDTCATEGQRPNSSWVDLLRTGNRMRYRTLLGVGLQAFQQLSGINAVLFFGPTMFSRFFSSQVSLYGTLAINVVNHLGTYITLATVDRYGRVALMLVSGAGMAIVHCMIAGLDCIQPQTEIVGVLVICLSCVFVVFFSLGWGPVVWTVCSEIFPLPLRGKGISVTTAANWGMATVVGKLFPLVSSPGALDLSGTFLLFGAFCGMGTLGIYFLQPETSNATLEEIDAIFAAHHAQAARAFWRETARKDGAAPSLEHASRKLSSVL